ncbi:MAG: hypothetical protein KGI67_09290 [Pseudomonadota bacterium]|nr:hypothetical protein [Pseudomonadota bacterium]
MADKYLNLREWKAVSKDSAVKGDALSKALAAFAKAEDGAPQAACAALDEVRKQADLVAKAAKDDKRLSGWLADLDKSIAQRRRELTRAAEQAAAGDADADADADADDAAAAALFDPKRLLGQLNLLRRDPERRANFAFVDASDTRAATLTLSSKMAARKLFSRLQDATGTRAGAFGATWLQEDTLVLQVDKPLSGLLKKMRGPMRACGFRVPRIVLWGPEGNVLEESGEAQEGQTAAAAEAVAAAAPDGRAPEQPRAGFEQRLRALTAPLQAALGDGHPAAAKLREVLAFARDKAQTGQFGPALQALDVLQKLLAGPADAAAAAASAARAAAAPADYARCHQAWSAARGKAADEIKRLRDTILAEYQNTPLQAQVATRVGLLDELLEQFDDDLAATLQQAGIAADDSERARLHGVAADSIRRLLLRLDQDPVLRRLKDNPFAPIDPRAMLAATLQALARQLA